jgi:hypothetical protein
LAPEAKASILGQTFPHDSGHARSSVCQILSSQQGVFEGGQNDRRNSERKIALGYERPLWRKSWAAGNAALYIRSKHPTVEEPLN